jgi:hypothetical protein
MNLLKDEVALLTSLWEGAVDKDLLGIAEFASLNPLVERSTSANGNHIPQALNGSAYVQVLAQNIKAIELAQELVGDDAKSLGPVVNALKSHLRDFAAKSDSRSSTWAEEYEKVVGSKPDWPAPTTAA